MQEISGVRRVENDGNVKMKGFVGGKDKSLYFSLLLLTETNNINSKMTKIEAM